jgi:hypothetical protein
MLILNEILARPEYDGVQVFFNSMLKELVEDDEEWRNRIDRCDLPYRIKKFTENFYDRFLCQKLPPQETITRDSGGYSFKTIAHQRFDSENALHFSLLTGNTTIFTFLCDCLDATLDKKQIQNAMMKSFMQEGSYFSFAFFRKTKSKLFKRFINYLDSEADKVMSRLTDFSLISLPPSDLEYSQWNGEEQQETVHHLLHFMKNQREAFDKYFSPNIEFTTERMLTFLIFNENYESNLKIFLGLLSQSTACSDDFRFANFLEKAFCSKKHFISGRIEKVLITLRELNRQNLLTQLYGIVLAKEPESFRNIYQPLPLERDSMGKDVTGTDLKILMKRDSYRMTRLHRAAFHGNTKAVDKMLGRIRQNLTNPEQNELAGKIINEIMARDEYGFTPFYVAAVRGHEKIYHKMLTFLKKILPDDLLENHWTHPKGFVHHALSDAIDYENVQMFQLILTAVKKVLGQQELIRILRLQKSNDSNSFFVECKTKELFNAMTKIVVMRDDNVMDYTDFYDLLVFHDAKSIQTLEYIDAENLQGLLLLRGVDEFTKRFLDAISSFVSGIRCLRLNNDGTRLRKPVTRQTLDSINLYSIGFPLLTNHLLKHFTKVQLEQFVETVTSKNNWKTIGGTSHGVYKSVDVNDPATAESITLDLLDLGWNREGLVFDDNGDGTTTILIKERQVTRNSYWRDFITSAAASNFTHCEEGFGFLEIVLRIYDCLKCLSDSFKKKLLLHEEESGFIMIQLSLETVQRMMTYLSQENQEEVKQQWKDNAPSMDTFFPLTMEQPNNDDIMSTARRWTNILRFYLHYGSEVQLEEFVKTITFLRNIGVERRSVWSYIFEHCHKEEKIKEILKLVSAKADILGSDALKTILLHKIDGIPLLLKAVLWGEDIDARLEILPKEIREDIQQIMEINAPRLINEAFLNPQTHFKIFDSFNCYNRLNTLIFFLSYSNDTQLQQFVQNITSFDLIIPIVMHIQDEKKCSIWTELLTHACHDRNTADIAKMDKFMKCLSEKLGSNAVKELVLHNDGERPVIFYPVMRGEEKLMEKMLKYLTVKDRKKVQRQVDQFLEETCKTDVSSDRGFSLITGT